VWTQPGEAGGWGDWMCGCMLNIGYEMELAACTHYWYPWMCMFGGVKGVHNVSTQLLLLSIWLRICI
jgi:hypothetical protein